jgi:hypothetical protein
MGEHLVAILDQHYSTEAAGTTFTYRNGHTVTANFVLGDLGGRCIGWTSFNLSNEGSTSLVTGALLHEVGVIYEALTGNFPDVRDQERTSDSSVITSHGLRFKFDGEIKILWEDESSRSFDRFIGELMEQMRDRSTVELCMEPVPTTYRGYEAILGKVRVCPLQYRHHLSESRLSPAWAPCGRRSAPGPLGSRIQRTPLYDYLHPAHTGKTSNVLFASAAVYSSAGRRAGTGHSTTDLEHYSVHALG